MNIILDKSLNAPLYKQIKDQVSDMIYSGTLPEGYVLPSERFLAKSLGINRTTVVVAYEELKADHLISSHVGKGTKVIYNCRMKKMTGDSNKPPAWTLLFDYKNYSNDDFFINNIIELSNNNEIISFAANLPDPDMFPFKEIAEIHQELVDIAPKQLVNLSNVDGYHPLRESICELMGKRNINVLAKDVMLFSSAQQAIDYCCRVLTKPNDLILVEEPTFYGTLQLFKSAGVNILGVPVDKQGIRTDILKMILTRYKPKFLYTIPNFHNPTGISMSLERRYELMELAQYYQLPIIEDDAYGELSYEETNLPSLKTLDTNGYVIYVGTFSKVLSAGLSVGWMTIPKELRKSFVYLKQVTGLHINTYSQWIINRFVEKGLYQEHLALVQKNYAMRRDLMIKHLDAARELGLQLQKPKGGLNLWCRLPPSINSTRLMTKMFERNIIYVPGEICYPNNYSDISYIRLNYTYPRLEQIKEGTAQLVKAIYELM